MGDSTYDGNEGLLNRADKIQHEVFILLSGDVLSAPLELITALASASQQQREDLDVLRKGLELSCPKLGLEAVEQRSCESRIIRLGKTVSNLVHYLKVNR